MSAVAEFISPKVVNWAERIGSAYEKSVLGILRTAKEVAAAQNDCSHGEWQQLVGRNGYPGMLPFKKSFAHMLARVGQSERIVQHAGHLPADATTIYKLTCLSDEKFEALLLDGTISPSMKRNEASAETRKEKKEEDEARILSLVPAEGRHRSLVIDPPWDYEWLSIAGRASPGYAVMDHDALMALDVANWAEDDCHLYLWTTNNFMTRAVELMAQWGFQHKTVLTWVKPRIGLGSYFRNTTEHALFGVRGKLSTRVDDIRTHFEAPMGEHSEKPDVFYDIVRRASYPPYGEIFQRKERPDFRNLYEKKDVAA